MRAGRPIDRLASVASFFVSRVDTETDRRIEARAERCSTSGARSPSPTRSWPTPGSATCCRAPTGSGWRRRARRPQRLLWASTGTKNPAYSDVLYVDSLIGPDTINTMPPATLQLFEDHGTVRRTLPEDASEAGIGHGPAGGGRRRLRRRHPRAGGRRDREVRQVVRGAARRDPGQAQGARRPGAAQAFRRVRAAGCRGRRPARRHGRCPAPQAHLGPRSDGVEGRPRHAGDPRTGWAGSRWARRWRSRRRPSRPSPDEVRARVRSRRALRHGRLEPRARGALAHLRSGAGLSLAPRARQHRSPGGTAGGAGGDLAKTLVHHLEQVGNHSGERQLLPLFLGAHRRTRRRSSSRSRTRARRSSELARERGSAGPSSIRPTSAAATRRCRSSAWCRRR